MPLMWRHVFYYKWNITLFLWLISKKSSCCCCGRLIEIGMKKQQEEESESEVKSLVNQLPESKQNTTQQQQVIAATHKFQYFTCKTMTTIQDCESYSWTVSLCDVGPLLQGQFILKLQCVVGLVHLYCHEFESQSAKCLCANDPLKLNVQTRNGCHGMFQFIVDLT